MQKVLLSIITVAVLWGACETDYTTPSYGCTDYAMQLSMQDSSNSPLTISNNTVFAADSDTGGYKFLALEALSDSVKIIFNIKDGLYFDDAQLIYDSVAVRTYHYNRQTNVSGGLVIAGVRTGNTTQYYETDSSHIMLSRWDVQGQTMSGSYYFEANNRTIKGWGTFTNVCVVQLN